MTSTVMVLCSGDGAGISFTRALEMSDDDLSVVGVDTVLEDHLTSIAPRTHLVPGPEVAGFIDRVNAIIEAESVDLVYVADTGPVMDEVFSRRDKLTATTFLPSSQAEICEDKWATHLALERARIHVPETALVDAPDDVDRFMGTGRPVWLRRRRGSGGAGSIPTDSPAFARAWVDHHDGWGEFTIAQRLGTRNVTVTALWWEGALQMSQQRERIAWKYRHLAPSGVTGITGIQKTIWDPAVQDLALAAVRAVVEEPHGIISVDLTADVDGRLCPTEIQPSRFFTSIDFLAAAGLNFPEAWCRLARGDPPRPEPLVNAIRDERFWIRAVDLQPRMMTAEEIARAGE